NVDVLPLDFYVTGYMYGRFYDMYEDDVREICGVNLADGMKSGSRLPVPFYYASQRGTSSGATGNAEIMGIEKIVAYLKTNNWSSRMVKTGASKFLFGEAISGSTSLSRSAHSSYLGLASITGAREVRTSSTVWWNSSSPGLFFLHCSMTLST
ncbi:MAG: hypothetical protein IJI11_08585, partial [Mogibacterium sp.]|nr:hypothetical protein [Mogibacterium sp.]